MGIKYATAIFSNASVTTLYAAVNLRIKSIILAANLTKGKKFAGACILKQFKFHAKSKV